MAKPKAKAKPKVDKHAARVAEVRAAMAEHQREIDQMWALDQALAGAADAAAVATSLLEKPPAGALLAQLRIIAGVATDEDARAIVELCTRATSGRVFLTSLLAKIEARVDDASLARAITQLEIAVPFAPLVLGRGRAVLRGTPLGEQLDVRAAFVERNAALLDRNGVASFAVKTYRFI